MNVEAALAEIELVIQHAEKAKALLSESGAGVVVVPAGGDLQAALDVGGAIEFEGTHEGTYLATIPGTRLVGRPGSALHGVSASALIVPPGSIDIELSSFAATCASDQAVIRLGANDTTQTNSAHEPHSLTLRGIRIPTHRGKRGFEVNARSVLLEDCDVRDLWDPAGRDSQAVGLINSSGYLTVRRGHFEAGSEVILAGGDTMKMAGVVPTDLLFEDVELFRPLAWKGDGVKRNVKNLFELKTGNGVILRRAKLSGCWVDAQTGHAIVLTPTRDGQITNVAIEDCTIANVGSGLQILGRAYRSYTPTRLSLLFQRNTLVVDHVWFGGRGWLAEASAEPDALVFRQNDVTLTGTTLIAFQRGTVMEQDGSTREGGNLNLLEMTNNISTCPKYGLNLIGFPNGGPQKQGFAAVNRLEVFDNTFTGAVALMKANFPENTYQ